ncbi:hypothetical protein [Alicyclobacillus shizuokensis]|uniref:hypothetical protein n=1 Tax=Alicyclobacillus shizuokensis TaxID=392014 RepID=UPI000829FEDC|nr:hypothetical protein [Alicyclobacillus shizuokensis]
MCTAATVRVLGLMEVHGDLAADTLNIRGAVTVDGGSAKPNPVHIQFINVGYCSRMFSLQEELR